MKEYLDVLNENGDKTGKTKLRDEIHRDGDWHSSVHIWLICEDEVLVQKRSALKESYPGCFDASAAGHVSAGEEIVVAAQRECLEEIGVDIADRTIIELGVLKLCIENVKTGFISNEFNHVLAVEIEKEQDYQIDSEEIEKLQWMSIESVYSEIEQGNKDYCVSLDEIELIRNRFGGKK